ncbi:MAG: TrmB family transcriptional regulator [Euryarchaeota archaeon]|nr:TrmB family transcriptional regulator [Euryarchaeota archaeon]
METESIVRQLSKLDLTEAESRVYLLLMRHGTVTAGELARISAYSRPKVYEILDKLLTLGLVESFPGRPIRFRAFDPGVSIPALFAFKKNELETLENGLTGALRSYYEEVPSRENEVFINQGLTKSYTKYCELVRGARKEVFTVLGWVSRKGAGRILEAHKAAREAGARVEVIWFDNRSYRGQVDGSWVEEFSRLADRFHTVQSERTLLKNPPTNMLLVDGHSALIMVGDYLDDGRLKDVISVHYHNVPAISKVMKKLFVQFSGYLSGGVEWTS